MTIREFIESYNELAKEHGASLIDYDFIVWNPNTKQLDEIEDICINGNAIQFNIPEESNEE